MIIVNQDKNKIVNFSNLTQIYISHCEEDNTGYYLRFETVDSLYDDLGEYATEKRAKEVLQEIIKAYIESKKVQEDTSMFGFSIIPRNTYYEMPKE